MERLQTLTPPSEQKIAPRAVLPLGPAVALPPALPPAHSTSAAQAPQSGHDDEIDLNVPEPRRVWLVIAAVAGLVLLAALLLMGLLPRQQQNKELEAAAAAARDAA